MPNGDDVKREKVENILVMGRSGAGKQPRIDVLMREFGLEQLSTGDIFRHYMRSFNDFGYAGDLGKFWDEKASWFIKDERTEEMLAENAPVRPQNMKELVLGMKAKFFVDNGKYVPDEITNALFEDFFSGSGFRGKVLDGYPRTVGQAKFMTELSADKGFSIDFAILVDNSEEAIIDRLLGRRICPECKKVFHMKFKPPREGLYCTKCGTGVIIRSDDTEDRIRSRLAEFTEKTMPAIRYLEGRGLPIVIVPGHLEVFTPENVRLSVMSEVEKILDR